LHEVHVDGRVLSVTLALSVMSGILFGLLPALHSVRARTTGELTTRETAPRSVRRLNSGLVVAQLALSVVLLIAAGLMLESFQRLTALDLGFRPEGVTSIALPLPPKYNSASAANPFYATVLDQVRATPGIKSAALAWGLPFESEANYDGFLVGDRPAPPSGAEGQTYQVGVSPGYFATMGIPLLFGRDVSAADDTTSVPVAVIDESIAKRYWKGTDAIGKRIRVTGDTTWLTIVGVVGAIHDDDATRLPAPHIYVSLRTERSACRWRSARGPILLPLCAPRGRWCPGSIRRFRSTACGRWRQSSGTRWRQSGSPRFCSRPSPRWRFYWPPSASMALCRSRSPIAGGSLACGSPSAPSRTRSSDSY
jgi:hypothetical protein